MKDEINNPQFHNFRALYLFLQKSLNNDNINIDAEMAEETENEMLVQCLSSGTNIGPENLRKNNNSLKNESHSIRTNTIHTWIQIFEMFFILVPSYSFKWKHSIQ